MNLASKRRERIDEAATIFSLLLEQDKVRHGGGGVHAPLIDNGCSNVGFEVRYKASFGAG